MATLKTLLVIAAILLAAACAKRAPDHKTGNPILDNPAYGTMEQRRQLARDWGPVTDPVPPPPTYNDKK